MNNDAVHFRDLLPLMIPFLVAAWCAVSYTIARLGWRRFSARYPSIARPDGTAYTVAVISFGSLRSTMYRNTARIIITRRGIYFYMLFLFRMFNPPFLVPWSSVTAVSQPSGLIKSYYEIVINDQAGSIYLLVHKKAEKDLFAYYKRP
jgi:hypothetical protein